MRLKFRFINANIISCRECKYYIPSPYPDNNPGDCSLPRTKPRDTYICFTYRRFKRL